MFYSPLRYPGGKGKLEPFMELLIRQTGHEGGIYVEPFAGGAGIAIGLLEKGITVWIKEYGETKSIHTKKIRGALKASGSALLVIWPLIWKIIAASTKQHVIFSKCANQKVNIIVVISEGGEKVSD